MNRYHVLTLFPEMIENGLKTSITGWAIENGTIGLNAVNIRDFADNKHNKVDDYPYGGGAGMVMQAEPVYRAWASVTEKIGKNSLNLPLYTALVAHFIGSLHMDIDKIIAIL